MEEKTMNGNGIHQIREKGIKVNARLSGYVSASRLKLWLKCPLAFRLKYVDHIVTPSTPSLFLGKVVHRALEYHYSYRQRGVKLFPEFVTERIDRDWHAAVEEECIAFKSIEEERELQAKATQLVTAYLAQVSEDEAPPIAVEERFEAPLIDPVTGEDLGIPLVGIIDLVLGDNDRAIICDFKTAARSSSQLDVMHELQLSCYSYLFRRATGRTESGLEIRSLIKTKTPKVEVTRFGPRQEIHFQRLFAVIRAYLDAISNKRFHISPGLGCSFCDYQHAMCRN
jgi:DNA helicase-2/ATP-dependent DNA helicase PcrA